MSRSTQDKVLKAIETAATDYGSEVIIDHAFANTGRLEIESIDTFEPLLRFEFRFNQGSFHFDNVTPHLAGVGRIDDRNNSQTIAVWQDRPAGMGNTADEVIKAIRNHLAKLKQEALEKEGIV